MLRSCFGHSAAIRRYATESSPKPSSDVFLKNLLDKVKTIKAQPKGAYTLPKKNFIDRGGQSNFNNRSNNRDKDGQGNSFNRSGGSGNSNNWNNNRNNNNRASFNNRAPRFATPEQQKFSKDEYVQQRRAKVEKKFGSTGGIEVFDTSRKPRTDNNRARKQVSIFTAKTGARSSPLKRTRKRFGDDKSERQIKTRTTVEENYIPQAPRLPDLIKYSSNLAFSPESRMTRAVFQFLQGTYQVPDLYSDKVDMLDHGLNVIIQQPLTAYPYHDKLPFSNSKIMGPTIIDADFDLDVLNKTIEKTVFGKFQDLKIDVEDPKLKLNAQVVQNSLNRNIFFNYSERKERIYKSCAGLDTVQSLTE